MIFTTPLATPLASLLVLLCLNVSTKSWGAAYPYLQRSSRGLLMGDAFTAIADDEYTFFYNPAAMGRHYGLSFDVANPAVRVSNIYRKRDLVDDFPEDSPKTIRDDILGVPLHVAGVAMPGLKLYHYGLYGFVSMSTDISLENAIYPNMRVSHRLDRGLIVGGAYVIGEGIDFKRKQKKSKTSVGLSIKRIDRKTVMRRSLDLFSSESLRIITSSDRLRKLREALDYAQGVGLGFDLGIEHSYIAGNREINVGFSILDLGDTPFKKEGGDTVSSQKMLMSLGSSFTEKYAFFDYTFSLDIHPIRQNIDIGSKVHVGARFGLPFMDLFAGWNGGYFSYGVGLNLFIFKLVAGFYSVELGHSYKAKEGERATVSLNLLNLSFDPF